MIFISSLAIIHVGYHMISPWTLWLFPQTLCDLFFGMFSLLLKVPSFLLFGVRRGFLAMVSWFFVLYTVANTIYGARKVKKLPNTIALLVWGSAAIGLEVFTGTYLDKNMMRMLMITEINNCIQSNSIISLTTSSFLYNPIKRLVLVGKGNG